jgi:hypothetical protein
MIALTLVLGIQPTHQSSTTSHGTRSERDKNRTNGLFFAPLLYKQRTGKNKTVGGAFGMSAALCALFNNIKSDSSGEGGTRFTRDVFHNAFANADDNGAVVASSTATNPVEVLDQDFRVQV